MKKKKAKLGSEERPIVVDVQSQQRAEEIIEVCNKNNWKVIVGMDPNKPENITQITQLLESQKPRLNKLDIGRNDSCPCGSGKKYKKCCLNTA